MDKNPKEQENKEDNDDNKQLLKELKGFKTYGLTLLVFMSLILGASLLLILLYEYVF